MPEIAGSFICFFDEKKVTEEGLVVGGLLISKNDLPELDSGIISVKQSMGLEETDPIKWNMSHCQASQRKIGIDRVPELKTRMVSLATQLPIQVMMSHVWMGSASNLTRGWNWAFKDILQRLSIILDRKRDEINNLDHYPFMDVVFDWFPQGSLSTFFSVYQNAYVNGFPNMPRNQRPLPPLRDFKVCPCLVASSSYYSLALQFVDFLIGATGDFLTWCFTNNEDQSAIENFSYVYGSLRKSNSGDPIGYGLIVRSKDKSKIRSRLREIGLLQNSL